MQYIDPHIHMVSRTTDDYQRLAHMGCVACSEPAFWAGFDRKSVDCFHDYFTQLTKYEPARAAKFGIQHHSWICINAKEAENVGLSRDVIGIIPEFLDKPGVLGVGEIGLNKNTKNECIIFQEQADLAARLDRLILVHTPHLEDMYQGTRMILDMLKRDSRISPSRVLIDHVEEHTIRLAHEQGYWYGMTLYPTTKCTPQRAADMVEMYGTDRIMVNSASDWGPSGPAIVQEFCLEMKLRGHSDAIIRKVVYENPIRFFSQSKGWKLADPTVHLAGTNGVHPASSKARNRVRISPAVRMDVRNRKGIPVRLIVHGLIPIITPRNPSTLDRDQSSSGLIDRFLLTLSPEDTTRRLPGGGVERGETIEQAIEREIHEELGLLSHQYQREHIFSGRYLSIETTSFSTGRLTEYRIHPFLMKLHSDAITRVKRMLTEPARDDSCLVSIETFANWRATGLGFDTSIRISC